MELNQQALSYAQEKMDRNAREGKAIGSVLRVIRDGRTYSFTSGHTDAEQQRPVALDTIFRLYSMSKPITMTALMQLYERGKIYLEDPVYEYIPEVRDMRVAVEAPDGSVHFEKQTQTMTIKNLCTMTSGIAYPGEDNAGAREMQRALDRHMNEEVETLDVVRLAAREGALSFQPGERWMYGFSHDFVGAIVEAVSGMRYGEYLKKNIFEPLQMKDTGFFVPQEKRARFTDAFTFRDGAYQRLNEAEFNEQYDAEPAFQSGGGGLVGTVGDYSTFCQMLLNFGSLGKERLLGRKTVEMMATDQLSDKQRVTFGWGAWPDRGYGYGLGMRTCLRPWMVNGSVGEFGWDGMMGTWMAVDPKERMTVVYLQNMAPHNNNGMRLMPIIYGAMD